MNEELEKEGLSKASIKKLQPIIELSGTNDEKLDTIAKVLANSEIGVKGVEETRYILDVLKQNRVEKRNRTRLNSSAWIELLYWCYF